MSIVMGVKSHGLMFPGVNFIVLIGPFQSRPQSPRNHSQVKFQNGEQKGIRGIDFFEINTIFAEFNGIAAS